MRIIFTWEQAKSMDLLMLSTIGFPFNTAWRVWRGGPLMWRQNLIVKTVIKPACPLLPLLDISVAVATSKRYRPESFLSLIEVPDVNMVWQRSEFVIRSYKDIPRSCWRHLSVWQFLNPSCSSWIVLWCDLVHPWDIYVRSTTRKILARNFIFETLTGRYGHSQQSWKRWFQSVLNCKDRAILDSIRVEMSAEAGNAKVFRLYPSEWEIFSLLVIFIIKD